MKTLSFSLMGMFALTSLGQAAVFSLSGTISASQEVPTNSSQGTGSILGTFDDATNVLTWNITFSGLSGPATGMHFHGSSAPGVNAGVQVNIGAISGLTSPSAGSTTITPTQAAGLLSDLWYVNIHSSTFPGGEIRGQVQTAAIPEPTSAALLGMAALGLMRRRRR